MSETLTLGQGMPFQGEFIQKPEWIDPKETPPPSCGKMFVVRHVNSSNFSDFIVFYNGLNVLVDNEGLRISDDFDYWMPWEPPEIPKKFHHEVCEDFKLNYFIRNNDDASGQCIYLEGGYYYSGYSDPFNFCPACGEKL